MFAHRCHQCGQLTEIAKPVPGEESRTEEHPWYICYTCYKKNGDSFEPPEETADDV